jgi:hypothetical protein
MRVRGAVVMTIGLTQAQLAQPHMHATLRKTSPRVLATARCLAPTVEVVGDL